MLRNVPEIKLYGKDACSKTCYYRDLLEKIGLPFIFLDVVENDSHAKELRQLYANGKLNFPTITIGTKKLRNPQEDELMEWLHKLIPSMITIQHDDDAKEYVLPINGHKAFVGYELRNGKMYLVHSEVPYNLRGRGIGEELVLKTFERLTEEGHKAVASCSFIRAVKERHSKWKEIIE